jgi:hypothetical protein
VVICALGLLAYARALLLPFISDDYIQITLARRFGAVSGWADLAQDALYRCRATSLLLSYWTEQWLGLNPLIYNLQSLLLHLVNCLLVAGLGIWQRIGWRLSFASAAVFAVMEGHQEAVIWYAALPELLVFLFAMAALLAWIRWLHNGRAVWLALSLLCFLLALLSKESGVITVPLMALAAWDHRDRRLPAATWIAAFGLISLAYFWAGFVNRAEHLHYSDGTFSLAAPFPLVLANSLWRLLWVWGFLAIALLGWQGRQILRRMGPTALLWMVAALLPYSFLTYMTRVPSRHTYWASVAAAWLIAAALLLAWERAWAQRRVAVAIAAVFLLQQTSYLWIKKHHQYQVRALPTEELLRLSKTHTGPVHLKCFDYSPWVAQAALEITWRRPVLLVPTDEIPPHDGTDWACCELEKCRDWGISLVSQ